MNNFGDYYKIVSSKPITTGQPVPSVMAYLGIRLADNLGLIATIIVLVLLMLFFAYMGLYALTADGDKKWALNAASLCLGVFLGLFAGKKIS